MAEAGRLTFYVDVKHVDQGEIAAVECGRCAALVPSDKKAKHARVCRAVSLADINTAARDAGRLGTSRGRHV